MKIHWTINSIPELAVFPKRIRVFVWWEFLQNKAFRKWQTWLLLLCFILIVGLYVAGLFSLLREEFFNIHQNTLYGFILFSVTHLFISWVLVVTMQNTMIAGFKPLLRDFLKAKKPDQPFSEYLYQRSDSN